MTENEYHLNDMFNALTVIGRGDYVIVYDMKTDTARYSKAVVELFGLPDEFFHTSRQLLRASMSPSEKQTSRRPCDKPYPLDRLILAGASPPLAKPNCRTCSRARR